MSAPWFSPKKSIQPSSLEEAKEMLKKHEKGNMENRLDRYQTCVNEFTQRRRDDLIKKLRPDVKYSFREFRTKIRVDDQIQFINKYHGRRNRESGDVEFSMEKNKGWLNSKRIQIYPPKLFVAMLDEINHFVYEVAKEFEPKPNEDFRLLHRSLQSDVISEVLKVYYQPVSNHASTKCLFSKNAIKNKIFVRKLTELGGKVHNDSTLEEVANYMKRKGTEDLERYIKRKRSNKEASPDDYEEDPINTAFRYSSSLLLGTSTTHQLPPSVPIPPPLFEQMDEAQNTDVDMESDNIDIFTREDVEYPNLNSRVTFEVDLEEEQKQEIEPLPLISTSLDDPFFYAHDLLNYSMISHPHLISSMYPYSDIPPPVFPYTPFDQYVPNIPVNQNSHAQILPMRYSSSQFNVSDVESGLHTY